MADEKISDLTVETSLASGSLIPAVEAGVNVAITIDDLTTQVLTTPDFSTAVAATAAVTANTAKVTNATHTGDVTGATALTLDSVAITGKTSATPASGDSLVFSDVSDSGNLKKCLISDLPAPTSDTTVYKTTSDQTFSWTTLMQDVTGLSFTPAASTSYRIEVFCRWLNNSGGTTNGAILGHNDISSLGCTYINGFAYDQTTSTSASFTNPLRNNSPRTVTSSGSNLDGQMFKMDLIFRTGASPSGNFIFQASPENSTAGATVTIAAGAVMIVQTLT